MYMYMDKIYTIDIFLEAVRTMERWKMGLGRMVGVVRGLAQCSIARQSQWDHNIYIRVYIYICMFRSLSFGIYMHY